MKKFLSILLTTVMLLTVIFNVPIIAEEITEQTEENWKYTVKNGYATVTGYIGEETTVIIPETLGNYRHYLYQQGCR